MSPFRGSVPLTQEWQHFRFECADGIATVTLDRPDKLNALTFDSYADLRDLLAELPHRGDVRVLVLRGTGRAFCSGGDVHEIIGATLAMGQDELLAFTRMTGEVIRAMRECPIPIVAGLQGMAAGAGAVIALAADFRVATRQRGSRSCSPRSACPAGTWAPPTCCPGWWAWAGPPSCSCSATRSTPRTPSGSG